MKKALGLRSSSSSASKRADASPGSGGKPKKPMTVGELMRVQMRVSDTVDSRIRRGLLRISASQVSQFNLLFISDLPRSMCVSNIISVVICT